MGEERLGPFTDPNRRSSDVSDERDRKPSTAIYIRKGRMKDTLNDICARRHRGNENSKAANASIRNRAERQLQILRVIRSQNGATVKEIARELGTQAHCISGRISELKASGDIFVDGRRDGCGINFANNTESRSLFKKDLPSGSHCLMLAASTTQAHGLLEALCMFVPFLVVASIVPFGMIWTVRETIFPRYYQESGTKSGDPKTTGGEGVTPSREIRQAGSVAC